MITAAIWLAFVGAWGGLQPDRKNERHVVGFALVLMAAILLTIAVNQ